MAQIVLCVLLGVVVISLAQPTPDVSRVYENCAVVVGEPCVIGDLLATARETVVPSPLNCATNDAEDTLLVSDYRGLQIVDGSLSTVVDIPNNCIDVNVAPKETGGSFHFVQNSLTGAYSSAEINCNCPPSGPCFPRMIKITSTGGVNHNTTQPILTQIGTPSVYSLNQDVSLDIVAWNCTQSQPFVWTTAGGPNKALFIYSGSLAKCPGTFNVNNLAAAFSFGYRYVIAGGSSAASPYYAIRAAPAAPTVFFNLHYDDQQILYQALFRGENVTISAGPSYLNENAAAPTGETPVGLGSVNPLTGEISPDTSLFKAAAELVSEEAHGGRSNVIWALGVDGFMNKAIELDYSSGSVPSVRTFFEDPVIIGLDNATCPLNWVDKDGQVFQPGCRVRNKDLWDFGSALSYTIFGSVQASRSRGFWVEEGVPYAVVAYRANVGCSYCTTTNPVFVNTHNLDIWDLSSNPPTLVDRVQRNYTATAYFSHFVVSNGYLYYTDVDHDDNTMLYFPISSALGLDGYRTGPSAFTDNIPTGGDVYERRILNANSFVISYGRYGSTIFETNASGIAGTTQYASFGDPSTENSGSGALMSCGSETYFRVNALVDPTSANGKYSQATLEGFMNPVIVPITTTSTTTSSTSSTSTTTSGLSVSSTSSTTSSTTGGLSSTTTGSIATPSAPPSASAQAASVAPSPSRFATPSPSCLTPDVCKFECSKPDEPSKVPKPSVDPSKAPAASKKPEQRIFTIELTYESTAAECGADGPDCCDVRDWLGDDTVAASFFLCNADSTTKDRAPTYDIKDGTCTVFLAAEEGTDNGKITQAEFDAAVAALELSFDSLCPTDAKNCDASTQSGKSLSYVLGAASGPAAVSLTLLLAAIAVLAL